MAKSNDVGSDLASGISGASRHIEVLTSDEADQVAGGWFFIVALAVGCALLLKHD